MIEGDVVRKRKLCLGDYAVVKRGGSAIMTLEDVARVGRRRWCLARLLVWWMGLLNRLLLEGQEIDGKGNERIGKREGKVDIETTQFKRAVEEAEFLPTRDVDVISV